MIAFSRSVDPRRFAAASLLTLAALVQLAVPARAITIDWVTVGDPGNAADGTTYGAAADSFRIMTFEMTNEKYKSFLNAVAATDPYSLYNGNMGSNPRGGITRSGVSGSYSYAVKANMGDKPVNYVSWFDAARMANWLHNGQGSGSTESGAYNIVGGQTLGNAPARNPGALFYIPTEDQWYKAAYYKAGSVNSGYWDYATQSDEAPTTVTAGQTGDGSAGSSGNFANFNLSADWNSWDGNVTTVGTNGGPSAYGLFDMGGNVWEWNDLAGAASEFRGVRGGGASTLGTGYDMSSQVRSESYPGEGNDGLLGFRLASPVAVPEPSTWAMGLVGLGFAAMEAWRRRHARRRSEI